MALILDADGYLWMVDNNLVFQRIGYKNLLSDLVGSYVRISYDEVLNRFFICNATKAFMYTEDGLCEIDRAYTSIDSFGGDQDSVYISLSGLTPGFTTVPFAPNGRKMAHIEKIHLSTEGMGTVYGKVGYRFSQEDDFTFTDELEFSLEGLLYPALAAVEFKLQIYPDTDELDDEALFDRLVVSYVPLERGP